MKLLGFSFKKISIEKLPGKLENVKVVPNIVIKDIKITQTDLVNTKDEFLSVDFSYNINYEPDFAKLEFLGNVLVSVEQKSLKEILKKWKDKNLDEEFNIFLFNIILRKANIKALELEDDLNLPLHLPMPSVTKKNPSLVEDK